MRKEVKPTPASEIWTCDSCGKTESIIRESYMVGAKPYLWNTFTFAARDYLGQTWAAGSYDWCEDCSLQAYYYLEGKKKERLNEGK